jgi:hypothetical protein
LKHSDDRKPRDERNRSADPKHSGDSLESFHPKESGAPKLDHLKRSGPVELSADNVKRSRHPRFSANDVSRRVQGRRSGDAHSGPGDYSDSSSPDPFSARQEPAAGVYGQSTAPRRPVDIAQFYFDLSNYKRVRRLGSGACGSVYLALEKTKQTLVAVKELHVDVRNKWAFQSFEREVQILGQSATRRF